MALNSQVISILFISIFLLSESITYINFIVVSPAGNDTKSCLNYTSLELSTRDPCATLDYAFDSISNNRRNATKVVVEPGTYNLTKNASFEGIVDIEISGNGSSFDVEIVCGVTDVGITFIRNANIRIENITITGCGTLHHSTIGQAFAKDHKNHTLFYTGLFFAYCRNITIQGCLIHDTIGTGVTMYDVGGEVIIHDSRFVRNTPGMNTSYARENNYALAGGGVYFESTYDGALPPFDVNDPERLAFQHDNRYIFENCTFKENKAPEQYFNLTIHESPKGIYHMPFGGGGGMSLFFKGNASNNNVTLHGCNFVNNTAFAGSGVFVVFQDETEDNHVTLSGSKFIKNNAIKSGGGVYSAMRILEGHYIANTIKQTNNVYEGNVAVLGGAVSHFGVPYFLANGEKRIREVVLNSCIFKDNSATVGAAMSFSTRRLDLLLHSLQLKAKLPWKAVLENITVSGNRIILTEDRKVIGQGALFTSGVTVELRENALFENNSDTALVLDNAMLIVKDKNDFFNNTAIQGGAIGVYGLSAINLMPGSTLEFIGNSASQKGGAMYIASNGPPVLGFQSTAVHLNKYDCFLSYNYQNNMENVERWNTSIIFGSNTAKIGGGNSVYVHSLQSCRKPGEGRTNNKAMQWSFITYRDSMYDGFNIKNEVATDPLEIIIYDYEWRVAPGEEFSPTVGLYDEKNNLVQGIVQISLGKERKNTQGHLILPEQSRLQLIEPQDKNTSIISGMKIKGRCRCPYILTLTTLSGQTIKTHMSNFKLNDCYMGYKLDEEKLECRCRSELLGVSKCSDDRKYVYLYSGYWGGLVGNSFATYTCPIGYCSEAVTSSEYKMIPGTLCAKNRDQDSVLCGNCKQNCSVFIGSEECGDAQSGCSYNTLYWFVPVLFAFFILLVLFFLVLDLDIFTVYLNAYLYAYQVIPLLISQDNESFFQKDYFISFVIGLANGRISVPRSFICIKNLSGLTKIVMEYSFPGFVVFVLVFLRFTRLSFHLSKFSNRVLFLRHVRQRIRGNMKENEHYNATPRALCNLLVWCYTDVILTSFKIIRYVHLNGKWVFFYDGSIEFYEDWRRHLGATVSAILFLFLALVLAIILILVPQFCHSIPGYHRIRIFFDLFQSCFEETPKQGLSASNADSNPSGASQGPVKGRSHRWFAGFYFLCRYIVFLLAIIVDYGRLQRSVLEIACVVAASVCLYVKPYNSQFHWLNISDAILLVTLYFIANLSTAVKNDVEHRDALRITVHVLTYVPLIYLAYLMYLCVRCCRDYYQSTSFNCSRQGRKSTSSTPIVSSDHHNGDDDNIFPDPSS